MPRPHRMPVDMDFVPEIVVPKENTGFLDIVSKFGPLVIAIIAVAFCFYIYKKMNDNDCTSILSAFMETQTNTNTQIQDSYNLMVEQFNKLSGIVHNSVVSTSTVASKVSPPPSSIVEETTDKENETTDKENETSKLIEDTVEIRDDKSDISITKADKPKRSYTKKNKSTDIFEK